MTQGDAGQKSGPAAHFFGLVPNKAELDEYTKLALTDEVLGVLGLPELRPIRGPPTFQHPIPSHRQPQPGSSPCCCPPPQKGTRRTSHRRGPIGCSEWPTVPMGILDRLGQETTAKENAARAVRVVQG